MISSIDPVELARQLIACPSITPARGEVFDLLEAALLPLIVSARTEDSLRALAESWRDRLVEAPPQRAAALLRSAARRRDHHPQRLVAFGADQADTIAALAGKFNQLGNAVGNFRAIHSLIRPITINIVCLN